MSDPFATYVAGMVTDQSQQPVPHHHNPALLLFGGLVLASAFANMSTRQAPPSPPALVESRERRGTVPCRKGCQVYCTCHLED